MARRKKRKSQWRPAAVGWRVLFGHNGPTRKAMKKAWRNWVGPHAVASARFDADLGKVVTKGQLRQKPDGTFVFKAPAPKKRTTRQRVADVQKRIADESDRHAKATATRPVPMTQRVKRKPDGTFNGSKPATLTPAEREAARIARSANVTYNRAVKSAAASERRIKRELGH